MPTAGAGTGMESGNLPLDDALGHFVEIPGFDYLFLTK